MAEQRQRGRAADDAAEVGADGIDDPIEVRAAVQRREDENPPACRGRGASRRSASPAPRRGRSRPRRGRRGERGVRAEKLELGGEVVAAAQHRVLVLIYRP
jgi:hypothetical protein